MNDTVREFLDFLKVDAEAIAALEASKIKSARAINPIIEIHRFTQPGYPMKHISIADIVGHNRKTQGSLVYDLSDYFDRDGCGYCSRSLGLLQIGTEELMDKLADSFIYDPIQIDEFDKNIYGIGSNGMHRFHVIKMHYLAELLKNPQAAEDLREKYTFPVKAVDLDFTKTYSRYLIETLCPMRFRFETEYDESWTQTGRVIISEKKNNGKSRAFTDAELVDFTRSAMDTYWDKSDEIDRQILTSRLHDCCVYDSFKEYYAQNLKGHTKADWEVSDENSSDKNFG